MRYVIGGSEASTRIARHGRNGMEPASTAVVAADRSGPGLCKHHLYRALVDHTTLDRFTGD